MNEKRPNFFIIGAPKCGTTSLAAWLAEHPNVYLSPMKEPLYFSSDIKHRWVETWEDYIALFNGVNSEHIAIGEASVFYLFSQVAVPKIEQQFPESRYIVMIRNPVDLARSLHEQHSRRFYENVIDFRKAWHLANDRRQGKQVPPECKDPIILDYPSWCLLGEQLERLYNSVPKERVLVLVLDDINREPQKEYQKVLKFLNIPDDKREDFKVHNPAREWRAKGLAKGIRVIEQTILQAKKTLKIPVYRGTGILKIAEKLNELINTKNNRFRQPLPEDLHAELVDFFSQDLHLLEKLIGREFPEWRQQKRRENEKFST